MITQYEVTPLLKREIPQLTMKTYPSGTSLEVYVSMNYFSDYTRHAIEQHDFSGVKKCFSLAERLYYQGDRKVRMLIENIFVYAFSSFLSEDKPERKIIKSLVPFNLYSIYCRQLM
jgi:hypothetical protein